MIGCLKWLVLVVLVGTGAMPSVSAQPQPPERRTSKELIQETIKAAGGEEKLLTLFRMKDRLTFTEETKGKGPGRDSVCEPPLYWWSGTKNRNDNDAFMVWGWTLRPLLDLKSKLENVPDVKIGDRPAYGIKISESIKPPLTLYFDRQTKLLTRIDWRSDELVFTEWSELDGLKYPSKGQSFLKGTGKPQWRTEILKLERLKELPKGLSREPEPKPKEKEKKPEPKAKDNKPDLRTSAEWYKSAYDKRHKGDLDGAIADASEAIRIDPKNAKAWLERGISRNNKKDYDSALKDYDQAVQLDPKNADAVRIRGETKYRQKNYTGAIEDYSTALKINPKFSRAYGNRAEAYERLGKVELALADYNRSIELDNKSYPWFIQQRDSLLRSQGKKTADVAKLLPDPVVDADFPGGNIIVKKVKGDDVYLHQDLRDTAGDWFYWYFRVRGIQARTVTFHFAKGNPIGVRGPAVSTDAGKSWQWLGARSVRGASFSYAFAKDVGEVRFCFAFPYQASNLRAFLKHHEKNPHLKVASLCKTKKDRDVELLLLGRLDGKAEHCVALTCRHHSCEMMASYVLEGIIDAVLANTDDGKWLRQHAEFFIVPMVDKDGVEDGDQGKNRKPRDHNRDYDGKSIYSSVAAIRERLPTWSAGKLRFAMDMHCPWIGGGNNESIFFCGGPDKKCWRKVGEFCKLLEASQTGTLVYRSENNVSFGQSWNNKENFTTGKPFSHWAAGLPCAPAATTIEVAYANAEGRPVTDASARALGHDLARALRKYLESVESVADPKPDTFPEKKPAAPTEKGTISPERLKEIGGYYNDFTPGRTPTREEIAEIEKQVAANPNDFKLVRQLGIGYFYRVFGGSEAAAAPKAQKTLARALELKKDDGLTIAMQGALAYVAGKDVPELKGQHEKLFKKALELEPNNVGILSLASAVFSGNTERAIEYTERIRKLLGPEFKNWSRHGQQRVLMTQGQAYVRAGRLEEARACFEEGLRVDQAKFQAELDKLPTKRKRDDAWMDLLDGKNLTKHWTTAGNWKLGEEGVLALTQREGEKGWQRFDAYLWSKQQYKDFECEFEFKINKAGHSGFFFRVGDVKGPVGKSIEVQIYDSGRVPGDKLNDHDTGGIILGNVPGIPPSKLAAKPAGEWNKMHVAVNGNKVVVELNGTVVNNVALDAQHLKDRVPTGSIGFQDSGAPIWLRNVRVRDTGAITDLGETNCYLSLDLERAAKEQYGDTAELTRKGPHLKDWRVTVKGAEQQLDLARAVAKQYGPESTLVCLGVGAADGRMVRFDTLPKVVVPVLLVSSDKFHEVDEVAFGTHCVASAVLGVRDWYKIRTEKTFRALRPIIIRSQRTSTDWADLSQRTLKEAERYGMLYEAIKEYRRQYPEPKGRFRVVIVPFTGYHPGTDYGNAALGDFVVVSPRTAAILCPPFAKHSKGAGETMHGIGHELGHTFGLKHTSDIYPNDPAVHRSIMMNGARPPDAILFPKEIEQIRESEYFR